MRIHPSQAAADYQSITNPRRSKPPVCWSVLLHSWFLIPRSGSGSSRGHDAIQTLADRLTKATLSPKPGSATPSGDLWNGRDWF
jgi:hypothetical protein